MFNFNWIADLSEGWARFLVVMAFILPLIFALTLPRKYIYKGSQDIVLWKNLKIWVFVIVAVQVAIYIYF